MTKSQALAAACEACPGCCCKMFFMRNTRKQFHEELRRRRALDRDDTLYQLRFILAHFHEIPDTRSEDAKSWMFTTPYAYTCDMFDEEAGVCLAYDVRPDLCRNYHCQQDLQAAEIGPPDPDGFSHLDGWSKFEALKVAAKQT